MIERLMMAAKRRTIEMGKHGPKCSICTHPKVEEINRRISENEQLADIARELAVSRDALYRHKDKCIVMALCATPNTKEIVKGDALLKQLQDVREKALSLLDMAILAGDTKVYGAPSTYLSEIRQQIKLWAELEGRLASQPTVNVLINPQWIELRTLVLTALDDHPEARQAVIDALSRA